MTAGIARRGEGPGEQIDRGAVAGEAAEQRRRCARARSAARAPWPPDDHASRAAVLVLQHQGRTERREQAAVRNTQSSDAAAAKNRAHQKFQRKARLSPARSGRRRGCRARGRADTRLRMAERREPEQPPARWALSPPAAARVWLGVSPIVSLEQRRAGHLRVTSGSRGARASLGRRRVASRRQRRADAGRRRRGSPAPGSRCGPCAGP